MTLTRYLRSFLVVFVLFLLLDAFWHNGLLKAFYAERLAMLNPALVSAPIGLMPQILFVNALNAITLTYVVLHHRSKGSYLAAAVFVGALLGVTVTGTVNFLNNAFVPAWDITLALVDTAWGLVVGIVGGLAAAVTGAEERRGLLARLFRR